MKKHFYFIGIGGIGMGTLASLLLDQGYLVSGSDIKENYMTKRLKEHGAEVFIGHDSSNIGKVDAIVYSSAIGPKNPEIIAAKQKNIPIFKRAQLLAQLIEEKQGITIAGAHGKTTTASMIACMLINGGLDPTTAVGGIIDGSTNSRLGEGAYFVAEVDESDGSFLYFTPYYSIITNIDFEHIDHYGTWDNILESYKKFISNTHKEGNIIAYGEDDNLKRLLTNSGKKYTTYGFSSDSDVFAKDIVADGYHCDFNCVAQNKTLGRIEIPISGKHNILNALACICLGLKLSLDFNLISDSLKNYSGVERRLQLKADINEILVIDDYGHHPTEITHTLQALRSFNKKRIITVFQPHRYTRTKYLMDEFAKSLSASDYLIITDIYAASEKPIEGVTSEVLCEKIKERGIKNIICLKKDKIVSHLIDIVQQGDIVLTLGAGDINRVADNFVNGLKKRL